MKNKEKDSQESNYSQAVKSTGLFGGVQIITLLASLIRNKLTVILLGTTGFGMISLYNTSIALVSSLTNLGIGTSGTRSVASVINQESELTRTIKVTRKYTLITALLGVTVTVCISPFLSWLSFGNYFNIIDFILLSPVIGLLAILGGELAILKGMRKLRLVALISIFNALSTLCATIPIYYIGGIKSIIPSLVISTFFNTAITLYYSNKIVPIKIYPFFERNSGSDYSMIKIGISLTFSSILISIIEYAVRAFILRTSNFDFDFVGLYNAAYTLTTVYCGMIFTAMATEFFPRLSANHKNNKIIIQMINQQIEVALLLVTPLLILFITFIPQIIHLLYTPEFLEIKEMVHWASINMLIKSLSFPIGYFILAKGDSKVFITHEILSAIVFITALFIGYKHYQLTGLGIAITISAFYDLIQVYIITKFKYNFQFTKKLLSVLIILTPEVIISFSLLFIFKSQTYTFWFISFVNIIISSYLAFKMLNRRTNIIYNFTLSLYRIFYKNKK